MEDYSYEIKKIQNQLNKSIIEYSALIKAWKAVKYHFKKDGEPFANLAKCFEGADYRRKRYAGDKQGFSELRVSCHFDNGSYSNYIADGINAYTTTPTEEQKKHTERIVNGNYLLTFEELRAAIYERIKFLQDRVDALTFQAEHVEYIYMHFVENLKKDVKEMRAMCDYYGFKGYEALPNQILESVQNKIRWM